MTCIPAVEVVIRLVLVFYRAHCPCLHGEIIIFRLLFYSIQPQARTVKLMPQYIHHTRHFQRYCVLAGETGS